MYISVARLSLLLLMAVVAVSARGSHHELLITNKGIQDNESPLLDLNKLDSHPIRRHHRKRSVRRCGKRFVTYVVQLCNYCTRTPDNPVDVVKACCTDSCSDEFMRQFCCNQN
ncbi:hypothetical protein QR680_008364 [Steinernema hermaphroditum]|uniref:Insulin-like domain-containing protein n=1 Tax=Steinernema hermaphroditum TaxID=289476 RepID=A0AA39IGC2_9BILA|nr:hypothetical protein QR680_008364 [Steinernema hermaphroditum]